MHHMCALKLQIVLRPFESDLTPSTTNFFHLLHRWLKGIRSGRCRLFKPMKSKASIKTEKCLANRTRRQIYCIPFLPTTSIRLERWSKSDGDWLCLNLLSSSACASHKTTAPTRQHRFLFFEWMAARPHLLQMHARGLTESQLQSPLFERVKSSRRSARQPLTNDKCTQLKLLNGQQQSGNCEALWPPQTCGEVLHKNVVITV